MNEGRRKVCGNNNEVGSVAGGSNEDSDQIIMLLNDNKAGMEGLDKESINRIILEASKGSLYFENEQRKAATLTARIENQLKQLKQINPDQLEASLKKADETLAMLEKERDLSRVIVHIDMDAFYASVEMLSKPYLKDVPMAVGSNSMLSTSNYAARKFGVRAGMPGFIAKKLCPQLVILPLNFSEYRKHSSLVGSVLSTYDPNFSKMGQDEAYLDITDCLDERMKNGGIRSNNYELADDVVQEMRAKIYDVTNLTSSAGIAPNSMLAKVCSDRNKPNGQFRVGQSRKAVMEFIKGLPIRKISGIGKVSEQMLKSLDIHTCGELIDKRALLYCWYLPTSYEHFMRVGLGVGYGKVERDSDRKSMSIERTFADTDDIQELTMICENLCKSIVEDLIKENSAAKTVTLKIKTIDFQVKTRAKTLTSYTQNYEVIYNAAMKLLKDEIKNCKSELKLRLMGVRMSSFIQASDLPKVKQKSIDEFLSVKKSNSPDKNGDAAFPPLSTLIPASSLSSSLTLSFPRQLLPEFQDCLEIPESSSSLRSESSSSLRSDLMPSFFEESSSSFLQPSTCSSPSLLPSSVSFLSSVSPSKTLTSQLKLPLQPSPSAPSPGSLLPTISPSPGSLLPTISPSPGSLLPIISPSPGSLLPTISPSPGSLLTTISPSPVSCPICSIPLSNADKVINSHLDGCLSKQYIKTELSQSKSTNTHPTANDEKLTSTNKFSKTTGKSSPKPNLKRKDVPRPKKVDTLKKYFKVL